MSWMDNGNPAVLTGNVSDTIQRWGHETSDNDGSILKTSVLSMANVTLQNPFVCSMVYPLLSIGRNKEPFETSSYPYFVCDSSSSTIRKLKHLVKANKWEPETSPWVQSNVALGCDTTLIHQFNFSYDTNSNGLSDWQEVWVSKRKRMN